MKPGGPLRRRTGLKPGGPLPRRTPLRPVSARRAAREGWPPPSRLTGPDAATRALVLERDDFSCFCCGLPLLGEPFSLQHRLARGMGGTSDPLINSPANLLLLWGTATSFCHARVEGRYPLDHVAGYWLNRHQAPALTPVLHHRLGLVLLDHDGSVTPVRRAT